jgi:4-alpha-glucanotransferase
MDESYTARRAGVLLHISSLPSGRLNDDALRWLDFMAASGLTVWQVLPLVIPDANGSPYQSPSAFASDPRLLPRRDEPVNHSEFEEYCVRQAHWLDDFALFHVLKHRFGQRSWVAWPAPFRHREENAMRTARDRDAAEIVRIKEQQYRLDRAWHRIRHHAGGLGIELFGDIPIFIAHDSADTWSQPENFLLDDEGQPTHVTGVPPDYFAESGQRWGNPHYRWESMQADGFAWWIARMKRQFGLFDMVRIDHFRGLVAVWMIEASCETAVDGKWQATPGDALLAALQERFPGLPIVAEDLGIITEEVRALRRKYHLPGMAVLQFAFDHFEDNPHKPANITPDAIVYTGTHDNDTCVGWFSKLQPHEKDFVFQILGVPPTEDIAALMIETAMHSRAGLAMAPLQDFLGLGSKARMNTPGVAEGNWRWRFEWDMLDEQLPGKIKSMIGESGRSHDR